ncbi:hypothetical protein BGZ81_005259 [Podila clonocystis]|nr:hypothetical protein BGZ81_005259 [Podila clonocystis]
MSDKLTSSDSFVYFFSSLQSFYTSRERQAAEAAEARAFEAAEAIAALEDTDDVLLASLPEEPHMSGEKNTAPFIPTADLLHLEQCDIENSTQKLATQTEGRTAELHTNNTTGHIAKHHDWSQWEQCDNEHSTKKLVAQIEGSVAELSSKDSAWHGAEHYETSGKSQVTPVPNTQDSLFLALLPLHQSKWAKPFTSVPAPNLINMNSSHSNRQGRSQPTGLEPKMVGHAGVTTVSLEASKRTISQSSKQGGAVKPTDQGHTISSSSRDRASSGLDLSRKGSEGRIQEKPRQRYSPEFLLRFSKHRKPPPNIYRIVSTICYNTTKPKGNVAAQISAPNATIRNESRNTSDGVPTAGTLTAKNESTHPATYPIAVRPPASPTKPSPNVQQSRASGSGGLGGKVFSLSKSRDPKVLRAPPR